VHTTAYDGNRIGVYSATGSSDHVLDRVPQITAIEYVPDEIVKALLKEGRPDYQYGNEEP